MVHYYILWFENTLFMYYGSEIHSYAKYALWYKLKSLSMQNLISNEILNLVLFTLRLHDTLQ